MLTKLTLTIDQDVIVKAKKYAHVKHRSVSKLVEEYLRTVSDSENIRPAIKAPSAKDKPRENVKYAVPRRSKRTPTVNISFILSFASQ